VRSVVAESAGARLTTFGNLPIFGDTLLYLMNASTNPTTFTLPSFVVQPRWPTLLDTFDDGRVGAIHAGGASYQLAAQSVAVFALHREGGDKLS
jgi:pullulanase/glycogen debranching enzyme